MTRHLVHTLSLFLLTTGFTADAQQYKTFGDYSIHYSAFRSDALTPEIARVYNITRSKNRALLNITILKKAETMKPVRASIVATATNLSSQLKTFEMREINEQDAIYYITEVYVAHRETLQFNLAVTPEGEENTYSFSFRQEFFTQ
jgi:hypothetical protein